MRIFLVLGLALALLLPGTLEAQSIPVSTAHLAHSILQPGQSQTLMVTARDLAGHPLAGASVRATVRYGQASRAYTLLPTDSTGRTSLIFRPPSGLTRATGVVNVSIRNGYLSIALTARFSLAPAGRGSASPSPSPTPKAATPTPARKDSIVVVARALPPSVTAPEPIWIVVYTQNRSGIPAAGARVAISTQFGEGTVDVVQSADSTGVATARIDTAQVRSVETVRVAVLVVLGTASGTGTSQFTVSPAPTPTPTLIPPSPTPMPPSATPTATVRPVAETAAKPADTPTATPLIVPTPTATFTPLPSPTDTPRPTPTNTPRPTPTSTSAATATPVQGPAPTPNCPGSQSACMQAMLNIINYTRSQHGVAPLTLNLTESNGTSTCVGSYGHSVHMQKMGAISHDQFPADICVPAMMEAENVGMWQGDELQAMQSIHNLMMGESYTPGCLGTHVCNILSAQFHQVGIGIYYVNNTVWLTEDFLA